jgi:hypothetical protein
MTSRGIDPGVRSQPTDVTRPERSGNSPEPRAKGSALRRLKTDVQIRFVKTAYGGDLRIRSARGKSVDGTGLNGLAGNKRSGSEGARDVLLQLIECQHCDWKKQIGVMIKEQLLQSYKNVKHHSAVLSAIEQTHGNPSELYDLARKIADTLTQAVRDKGMRADDIVPKPFDLSDPNNEEMINGLRRETFRPLLADSNLSAEKFLDQIIALQDSKSDAWLVWLPELSNKEIQQICNTIGSNGSLLSVIRDTYGHPNKFSDFAHGFVLLFKTEAERRKLDVPDMEPKALEADDPKYQGLVKIVLERDAGRALAEAQALPSTIENKGKPPPDRVLDLFEQHFAICSSVDFWSQEDAWRSFEPLGLAASIALLRQLSARLDAGGQIASEDMTTFKRLLRDEREPSEAYAAKVSQISIADDQRKTLFRMAKLAAEFYIQPRKFSDDITGDEYDDLLVNLQGEPRQRAINGFAHALAASDPAVGAAKLLATMEQAFTHYVVSTDFPRSAFIERFTTMAQSMQPLIFHP